MWAPVSTRCVCINTSRKPIKTSDPPGTSWRPVHTVWPPREAWNRSPAQAYGKQKVSPPQPLMHGRRPHAGLAGSAPERGRREASCRGAQGPRRERFVQLWSVGMLILIEQRSPNAHEPMETTQKWGAGTPWQHLFELYATETAFIQRTGQHRQRK